MSANLTKVIKEVNWMAMFSNGRTIDPRNITIGDATRIFRFIDSELSPEHLTCDGERPFKSVVSRRKMLDGAVKALNKKGFRAPSDVWNIA